MLTTSKQEVPNMRDEPILVKVRFKGCEETRPLAPELSPALLVQELPVASSLPATPKPQQEIPRSPLAYRT